MAKGLLSQIIDHYLESKDFNGLYFDGSDAEALQSAVELVRSGEVQVVGEQDYPNPHIRPWPSRRSTQAQIESLESLPNAEYGVCLYPTPKAMASYDLTDKYLDQPYSRMLVEGRGRLELVYFRFDVLEMYRNDPRFHFDFDDFGAKTAITTEADQDEDEPEGDKILMGHIGFAYDLSAWDPTDPTSKIVRRVCAFLGDLAKLTPSHQLRWKTYQVADKETLKPHPIWWGQMMGHWPDGLGPFARFFFELNTLNELHERVFGQPLFHTTERPREFGWILRPSQHEFDAFVLQLDKLLSDNLGHKALDQLGVPRNDAAGEVLGTIRRLDELLRSKGIDEEDRQAVLKSFREVRAARQKPAHKLSSNITDATFINRQADLLERVTESLWQLRKFWQSHPKNSEWKEPDYVATRYRL